jgi:3,5-epimerase/4-reductase
MKILLLGHNGWIGQQMLDLLNKSTHEVILSKSRAHNIEEIENEIIVNRPTHIMSFIGRTHGKVGDTNFTTIDYLEQPGKLVENVRDNLFSPLVLGLMAQKYNIHYTYLGTGCIFEYDNEHLYGEEKNGFTEDSKPNFVGSSYSVVKGYTDQLMHLLESNTLNLRIRMPITDNNSPRNFITKITNYKKICSIPNSMTVLPELLPYIIKMAEKNVTGTYNFTNPGLISHNEILEMYKEYVDNDFQWENFTVEEQNQILASKRSNNFLETTKLSNLFPEIKNIKESVKHILMNYKLVFLFN